MSNWPSSKASRVYRALLKIGWRPKHERKGSHVQLCREGFPDYTWAWHDSEELGPVALKKIAKYTGLNAQTDPSLDSGVNLYTLGFTLAMRSSSELSTAFFVTCSRLSLPG